MALPYQYFRSLQDSRALPFSMELEVSLNLADGTPLKWSANGKLTPVSAQTDRPLFINNGVALTTAVGTQALIGTTPNQIGNGFNAQAGPGGNPTVQQTGGFSEVLPTQNGMGIWRTTFKPVITSFVSSATGSPTSIICPSSPVTLSSGALVGGTLFCATTGQQLQITASSSVTAGSALTLTTVAPLGQPGATINADGMTFTATPLGRSTQNIKWSALSSVSADGYVPSQLGVGSADWSGGFINIHEVDMLANFVYVIFA